MTVRKAGCLYCSKCQGELTSKIRQDKSISVKPCKSCLKSSFDGGRKKGVYDSEATGKELRNYYTGHC